jgi:tetratricopeptide (TPR) repeat protein
MKRVFLFVLLIAIAMDLSAQSSLKLPSLSPNAKVSQDFSLSNIEISYSRPSMRGRKVFGDVVAYGRPWRTGANAPTKIKIGEELEIGGVRVKAGEYALYTIPNKDKWEIILNTAVGKWTANGFPREDDVARFHIKAGMIDGECQTFTIMVTDITYSSCKIELVWERTRIGIPVMALTNETIETNIDKALNQPTLPYFQAASYYFENNKKMSLAQSYVNKALEQDPKAFYIWYLKARIERKLGNKEEAIVAAKKSMELAKGTPNEYEYMHNNQKIIDEVYKQIRPRSID